MPSGLKYSEITEGTNVGDLFTVVHHTGSPPKCTPGYTGDLTGCSSLEKCRSFMIERAINRMDSMGCVGNNCICRDTGRQAHCPPIEIPKSMSEWHSVTERNYYDPEKLGEWTTLGMRILGHDSPTTKLENRDPWAGFDYLGNQHCYDRAEGSGPTGPIQVIAPAEEIQGWYNSSFNEAIADGLKENYNSEEDRENCETNNYRDEASGRELDQDWWSAACYDTAGEGRPGWDDKISRCGDAAKQVIMPYIENYPPQSREEGACPRYIMHEYSNMTGEDPSDIYNNWKDS